jgi:ABC-type multidrug transport system fused ATPase/permease subunit
MSFFRTTAENEQLITAHREVKEQATQAGLRHARELEDAQAAAEAKLAESLEEYTNNTAVLRTELEEESKARKAAEDQVALLTGEQKEYDQLVMQTDALALSKFFLFLFRILLISLYLPVAFPYLFPLCCRALSGFVGACAEESGRSSGCAAVQESDCALGSL